MTGDQIMRENLPDRMGRGEEWLNLVDSKEGLKLVDNEAPLKLEPVRGAAAQLDPIRNNDDGDD